MQTNENFVELKIFDFEIQHEEISAMLGLTPTNVWIKGEEYVFGDPRNSVNKIREKNYWEYRSKKITNDCIGDQIEEFISEVIIPRSDVIRLITDRYHTELSVVQYMYDGCNPGLYFNKTAIKTLSNCGLELNVDLYVLYREQ